MQVFKRDKISIPTVVLKALPRVQPADVLAWEHFQYLRDQPLRSRPGKNLERLVRPIRKKQDVEGIMQESDLRTLCVGTDVPKREAINPGDTIAFWSEKKRKRKQTIV